MSWWFGVKLWKRVFLGLILGVIFGLAVSQTMAPEAGEKLLTEIKIVGDIFIAAIRLVIIPLIFFTLVAGVLALGDPKKLGTIGLKTLVLYLLTTFFANTIGLAMGTIFRPGKGVELGAAEPRVISADAGGFLDRIVGMATKNPFENIMAGDPMTLVIAGLLILAAIWLTRRVEEGGVKRPVVAMIFIALFALGIAMASMDILFLIFVSLVIGITFLFEPGDDGPAMRFFTYASDKVLGVTHLIMEIAPFGVFALIAWVAGTRGLETFTAIFWLVIAVYLGCFIHMAVVYGAIVKFGLKLPFVNFFRGILDAQMVAYSTSSSSATLPVTISNVTENLGVKKSIAGSVLPLGATINMDGTALYLGIVALFTAQAFGYSLEPHHYGLIALTAALVSIGTAGIPSASLFLLATVLQVFDVTPEHTAIIVGFIFPFDRLLDMMRTVVNVTGDATVAVTVAKWEGELDEEVFRQRSSN
ncbi:dicarboxylate/amino acid:cation symporter [Marinicaulis aureus]|uniref:Dicarboxylate/amino acid:cation symporter n=1 Tax=Hyphococcus aureus TaxID=2666033 RepID=A0ABW1KSB1_9PROT